MSLLRRAVEIAGVHADQCTYAPTPVLDRPVPVVWTWRVVARPIVPRFSGEKPALRAVDEVDGTVTGSDFGLLDQPRYERHLILNRQKRERR